jgi:hypothetical protein
MKRKRSGEEQTTHLTPHSRTDPMPRTAALRLATAWDGRYSVRYSVFETSSLSMRLPSISTISKRQPSQLK